MPRPKSKRNDLAVKIDADVLRLVRLVSAYENRTIADILTEIVKPVIEKRYERHIKAEQTKLKSE